MNFALILIVALQILSIGLVLQVAQRVIVGDWLSFKEMVLAGVLAKAGVLLGSMVTNYVVGRIVMFAITGQ